MERLTERDWKNKCAGYMWNVHPVKDIDDLPYYKKLAEYEDAEEQGLLVKLPCKIGDVVYLSFGEGKIKQCRVSMVSQKSDKSWKFRLTPPGGSVFEIKEKDFGEICFMTQEEAEAALAKMKSEV